MGCQISLLTRNRLGFMLELDLLVEFWDMYDVVWVGDYLGSETALPRSGFASKYPECPSVAEDPNNGNLVATSRAFTRK